MINQQCKQYKRMQIRLSRILSVLTNLWLIRDENLFSIYTHLYFCFLFFIYIVNFLLQFLYLPISFWWTRVYDPVFLSVCHFFGICESFCIRIWNHLLFFFNLVALSMCIGNNIAVEIVLYAVMKINHFYIEEM